MQKPKGKVRVTVEIDMESGDYDMTFSNLSDPGRPIDLTAVLDVLGLISPDVRDQAEGIGHA